MPSRDENGHGSNLAAVAAGSILGNGMEYMGVVCGGNEGNAAHHYQGNLNSPKSPGASREAVEVRVGPRI